MLALQTKSTVQLPIHIMLPWVDWIFQRKRKIQIFDGEHCRDGSEHHEIRAPNIIFPTQILWCCEHFFGGWHDGKIKERPEKIRVDWDECCSGRKSLWLRLTRRNGSIMFDGLEKSQKNDQQGNPLGYPPVSLGSCFEKVQGRQESQQNTGKKGLPLPECLRKHWNRRFVW